MNNLIWKDNSLEVVLDGKTHFNCRKRDTNYYEYGRHAIFLSSSSINCGYKYFIVKGICYELSKVIELYNIHKLIYAAGFGVDVYGLCSCYYKGKLHYGLIVEKLSRNVTDRKREFPINEFKSFCRSVKGLIKREYYYEELYGKDWYKSNPHLEFNVGENNIMYDINGAPKIVDIDPRWQIKK